jgi:hypothetical protein
MMPDPRRSPQSFSFRGLLDDNHLGTALNRARCRCGRRPHHHVHGGLAVPRYSGYRFPPEIIQQAIWLYVRFTLSFRDVEDLLAERSFLSDPKLLRF